MSEIKNTFLGGKMNKDLDERLLPKNEYRDALNVEVSTSQGDDVGSLQNTWGNTAHSSIPIDGAKCIGSVVDKENEKIYWFIKGTSSHAIAEYDIKLRVTRPVLVDFGMADTYTQTFGSTDVNINSDITNVHDILAASWTHPYLTANTTPGEDGYSWQLTGSGAVAVKGTIGYLRLFHNEINLVEGCKYEIQYDVTYVNPDVDMDDVSFILANHGLENTNVYLDATTTGTKTTQWVQGSSPARKSLLYLYQSSNHSSEDTFHIDNVIIRQAERFLNFDSVDHITGINVLDGMLIWTDGVNEPKKININRCKAGSNSIVNFDSAAFVGSELITNGNFDTSSNWTLGGAGWEIANGVLTRDFLGGGGEVSQPNVLIQRGKTYVITMIIGGSFTQGAIGPSIVDEFGGWTRPKDGFATSTGTYTWTLTSGDNNETMTSNQNANYETSRFFLKNHDPVSPLNVGVTIESISVREIAVDWNTTTKAKDASGAYTRNIKEEDITLIKKYPLNAPNMELINTTKPNGSVLETSCFTPMNTTYNYNYFLADGSGDTLRYNNFIHTYVAHNTIAPDNLPRNTFDGGRPLVQLNIGGPDYWENTIGSAQDGSVINQPMWQDEDDPMSLKTSLGNSPIIINSYTKRANYYKRAWQDWCSLSEYYFMHNWGVNSAGGYKGFSAGTLVQDKIGGRVWMNADDSAKADKDDVQNNWKKDDRAVFGYWNIFNNASFWTYKDGNGDRHVKPAGTQSLHAFLKADGTQFWDEQGGGGASNPVLIDPTEKYNTNIVDFGGGWSVVDGKYVGGAFTSSGDTAHPTNALLLNKDNSGAIAGDGWQYIHNVIGNIVANKDYQLRMRVKVIDPGPISLTDAADGPFGISKLNALDEIELTNGKQGKIGRTNMYNGAGTYYWKFLIDSGTGSGAYSFFKRNGAIVEIDQIQVDARAATPVRIQPLVFDPKPDYEEGDLVKLTNTTKAPNGDDIEVIVKLGEEYGAGRERAGKRWNHKSAGTETTEGYNEFVNSTNTATYAPEDYDYVITDYSGSADMIDDSDFATSDNTTELTFTSGGNLNTDGSGNRADWNTSLEMFKNIDFQEADPNDANRCRYWSLVKSAEASGTQHTGTSWQWHDGYVAGTYAAELNNGPNRINDWNNFSQFQDENPRIFWEMAGQYTVTMTGDNYSGTGTGNGIFMRGRMGESYYQQTSSSLFNTDGTVTATLSWTSPDSDPWDNRGTHINIQARDGGSTDVDTARLTSISCKANLDANRISWGSTAGHVCEVVAGTTSQIIGYPHNTNGTKAHVSPSGTGSTVFTLVKDQYYTMKYSIKQTNSNVSQEDAGAEGCWIKLFDHDAFGKRHQTNNTNQTSNGHILLDTRQTDSSGTNVQHKVTWKQSHNKTQLEICFGPAWEGKITDIEVFPVTVVKKDYGTSISNDTRKMFDATVVSIDKSLLQIPLTEHKYWKCKLLDQDAIFKDVFPRFAYRWKYKDGEYSAISAFTEVAFLPDNTYKYDANDGYNLSMENNVRRIILDDFDIMPADVTELDILYKESNSNNIYTFTTIKGSDLLEFKKYEITKEKFHALITSNQLLRPYDNIPRKAKSQEIAANRIVFGNYVQQYNITPSDEPIISTQLISKNLVPSLEAAKSVKSIRHYQIGVSYLDGFGRQSPVFSNDTALIKIDQSNSHTANDISASLNNFPPSWVTHYKYFVKDVAQSFYNISLDRFWQAERSDHVWLSFPSSDYNKVKEDDYIILKKHHNGDESVTEDLTIKYKVLARKGEAPEFIKTTRKSVGGRIFDVDGSGLEFFTQVSYGGSTAGYPQVDKVTFRIKGNVVESNQAFKEAVIDDQTGRYVRLGQEITGKPGLFSNYYEILHISRTNFGTNAPADNYQGEEDFYEFTLVQPLGSDASFVGSSFDADRKLFIEYFREELNEFDNTYEGKFFIKIARDNYFDKYVAAKQKVEDLGYNIINAQDTHWAHIYETAAFNTLTNKGQDTDDWLYDKDNFDWEIFADADQTTWSDTDDSGRYNGQDVTYFPALNEYTVEVNGSVKTNPYLATWSGTDVKEDYEYSAGAEPPGQRFCIDQTFSWNWSNSWVGFWGMDQTVHNSRIGNGFVMGNSFCSFSFQGIGDIDLGSDDAIGGGADGGVEAEPSPADDAFDTNTWFDAADQEQSPQWFNNFDLLNQLQKEGTQFRWLEDPSHTVYTVTKVHKSAPVKRYHAKLPSGGVYGTSVGTADWTPSDTNTLDADKQNYGWRIDLQLDKPIVWSPTATITSGTGWNPNGAHTTLVPFKNPVEGTTAQIQIIEKRAGNNSYSSFNPAVFEVVPKERADLNLYYETPEVGMVLKDGMYIEALNNTTQNDFGSGGNYNSAADVGSVYLPGGSPALPYVLNLGAEEVANAEFETATTTSATSGVENWVLSTNLITAVHDTNDNTLVVNRTAAAASFPTLQSDAFNLVDGTTYRLVVEVLDINNNVNGATGTPDHTKAIVIGASLGSYRPLPGSHPALNLGINQWTFTHSQTDNGGSDSCKVFIEFTDSTQTFDKMIKLGKVSITTYEVNYEKPIIQISAGKKYNWCDNPNQLKVLGGFWDDQPISDVYSPGTTLPDGITLRISERDAQGVAIYYKDYILGEDILPGTSTITLPTETLKWHNCFAFGNGVESHRLRDDYNAVTVDKGARVSTTLEEAYKEEKLGSGLIFSGIYNSTSSVNQLNQFIQAESITKELNPEYGSIQKLFTRNTNIVAFCENKILKILANKDALYNADGSMQVTASNKVLGQAIPFVGEYGMSRNPESFANFGYRVYFTDRDRGAVLRLSADGLTPISDKDMISYFKYTLPDCNTMVGSYDEDRDAYNLTLEATTVSFSEKVNGWTSFKSFLAESGISINGDYYTWNGGNIWKHHSNALRNNFYNSQYESSVKLVFNDLVDEVKNFNTLNYEGSTSRIYEDRVGEENQIITKGWYTNYIKTDLEEAEVIRFKDKEGKWFNNITGVSKTVSDINLKDFTSQGLGLLSGVDQGAHPNYKTLVISPVLPVSIPVVEAIGSRSGVSSSVGGDFYYPTDITYVEDAGYNSITGWEAQSNTQVRFTEHTSVGVIDSPDKYYMADVISNLAIGNTYYIEADVVDLTNERFVGFSPINMSADNFETSKRKTNGKIFQTFVYSPNPDRGNGIHLFKTSDVGGTIKNISCVNITPKSDELTYTVNSSSSDRTQATTKLEDNLLVGEATSLTKSLYIHSHTVSGIKYAVEASKFTVTSSNSSVEIGTLTDSGPVGYYENIVFIPITISYTAGDPFPDRDVESYINVQGGVDLAINQ